MKTLRSVSRTARIVLYVLGAALLASWYWSWLSGVSVFDASSFVVREGDTGTAVAARLKESGVIRSERLFLLAVKSEGVQASLQPGTYDLTGTDSHGDIARLLASGGVAASELTVLVKEGWSIADIGESLLESGFADAEDWHSVVGKPPAVKGRGSVSPELVEAYPFLATRPAGATLEGFMFPDTYRVFQDATSEEVAAKLLGAFEKRADAIIREAVKRTGRSYYDILIMASIIEREVRTDPDRALVADLFWKRIDAGMGLQADSTVNYATGKSLPSVTYDDLEVDSRYNTYKYRGLPPGPISNPGLAAIEAAANPKANPYWYFLTDPAGKVYYAETFDGHIENRNAYLR